MAFMDSRRLHLDSDRWSPATAGCFIFGIVPQLQQHNTYYRGESQEGLQPRLFSDGVSKAGVEHNSALDLDGVMLYTHWCKLLHLKESLYDIAEIKNITGSVRAFFSSR